VLFPARFWPGLADGSVTVAFRRWKRPTVKPGGTLQTRGGLLGIDEVTPIDIGEITDADARAAGFATPADVIAALRPDGVLHRVRFHRVGDDPRVELRQRDAIDDRELEEVQRALGRLPWSMPVLQLIAERPAVVSTELAEVLGLERLPFKQRVRRLKALGLTESLEVGYRLSPRGEAVLARLAATSRGRPEDGGRRATTTADG
jgi:hypothetical protein